MALVPQNGATTAPAHERFKQSMNVTIHLTQNILTAMRARAKNDKQFLAEIANLPPDVAQTVSDALSLYEFSYKPEPDYYVLQYIRRSYSCWGKVKDRDQSFFEENAAGIFAGIDPKTQDMYKFIARSKYLGKDELETLWTRFLNLIRISISYIGEKGVANLPDDVRRLIGSDFKADKELAKYPRPA